MTLSDPRLQNPLTWTDAIPLEWGWEFWRNEIRNRLAEAEAKLRIGEWRQAQITIRNAREALDDANGESLATSASGTFTGQERRRLENFVDAHLERRIAVAELVALTALPRSHFARAFRQAFGLPPLGYVRRKRVARAMRLMRETDESLSMIAAACGLADQPALCKAFRDVVGQTPGAWRRRVRAASAARFDFADKRNDP